MTRHTLHVPENLNDGTPVDDATFAWIEQILLDTGGGFTQTSAVGAWMGEDGTVYREPVRLYAVDADGVDLSLLAAYVRAKLAQEAVYVTRQEIGAELVYA